MTLPIRRRSRRRMILFPALALLACAFMLAAAGALAASTWVGNTSGTWNTAGNWNPAAVPGTGSNLVLVAAGSAGANLTNDLAAGKSFAGLTFSNGASAFTLNGNSFTVTGGITNKSANAQSISNPVTMTAATSVVSDAGGGLTFNGAYTATTAGAVTKVGSGTVTFAGTNTICGLIVNGGTNIITGTLAMTGLSGSYFFLGNANTAYNGTLVIQPGAALNVTGTFSDNFVIGRDGGDGTLIQNGGTFSYNNNQTYLYVGAANNANTRSVYNLNGGLLNLNGKTLMVGFGSGVLITGLVNQASGIITNAGTLQVGVSQGYGSYTMSGGSNYIGAGGITSSSSGLYAINLGGGTVVASASWSSSLNLNLTNLNGSVTFDTGTNTITLSGVLSGGGGLIKAGSGTLILSGVNTNTGDTTVNAGHVQLNGAGSSPSVFRIANGASLNLAFSGTYTVPACYTNNIALSNGVYNAGNLTGFITGAGSLLVGSVSNGVTYSYVDLIGRLTNLDLLAQLPAAGETSSEWTSRDRSSTYNSGTGQYLNWGANADGTGCISTQSDGGIVMAQMTGPGCIWRLWSAQVGTGHVKIFLDGSTNPAVDLAFQDYFNRTQAPFTYPSLVYTVCGGFDSYLPVPYNSSCKVVAYGSWGQYFHFNYSTFAPGITVPTFTTNLSATEQGALSNVDNYFMSHLGSDPAGVRSGQTTTTNSYAIAPGQSITALNFSGQGAITGFKVRVNGMTGTSDRWAALRALTVSMAWDGEANSSVWAPLGDFFGTACGYIPYTGLPLGMQSNGWMYCYWYMPFSSQAQIVIGNDDSVTRNVDVVITQAPLTKPVSSLARFHAKWNRGVYVTNNGRSPDYRFLTSSGQGRFVGLALHVYQTVDVTSGGIWWGEGDEKFFVDGETTPSWFGTGSEDYFGFAWGTPGYFTKAYHTQALAPPGTLYAPGNRALNRFHITDNVPFQSSFEGCLEKWFYTNDTITTYGAMPYWYLASGGSDSYSALPLSSRTNYYVPSYSFTWTNTAGGLWGTAGNWANAGIANGSGLGADFSALDLTANTTVHLDSAITIGSLIFGDTDITTPGGWILDNNGNAANTLTLAGSMPLITVNALGDGVTAAINAGLTAASGLTTLGAGTLALGGTNSFAGLIVNGGTTMITGNTTISGTGSTYFYLGNANTAYNGTLDLENGAVLTVNGSFGDDFVVGRDGGTGTVIQNGGTFNYNPGNEPYLFIGAANNTNTRSAYNMNGGLLDLNNKILSVGFGNGVLITGVVNQVGGVITNAGTLALPALQTYGYGSYTLSGGSIYLGAGGLTSSSGLYAINLGGGTVGAYASWSSALNLNLTNLNGSVTFDTAANSITLSGTLSGSGGLAKAGSGNLILSGANTYAGDTTINAGTLQLNGTGSSPGMLRITNGALLNLNFNGTYAVAAGYTNGIALPVGVYTSSSLPGYVAGTGVLKVGSVAVSPASYGFGSVITGTVAQATFTFTNSGLITVSGAASVGTAAYSIISGSPYTVAAGGTATVTVQFAPSLVATYNDTVQFTNGSQFISVPVTGRGTTLQAITNSNFIFAYEGFNYPAGTNLAGLNGGTGWSGGWVDVAGNGGVTVGAGNLPAGTNAPGGYDALSTGNSAYAGNGSRYGRWLDCSAGGNFDLYGLIDSNNNIGADGTTVYVSFLQQPSGTATNYEFEFHRGNLGDAGRVAGIGNAFNSTTVNLRAPNAAQTPLGLGGTNVNYYVVRIDFKPGSDDVYVYRNPAGKFETNNDPVLTMLAVGDMSFNGISLAASGNSVTVNQDEIRLGKTWGDILGGAPAFVVQPTNQTVVVGQSAVFTAQAQSSQPVSYQWYGGTNALAGQTNASLVLPNVQVADASQYSVTASNALGVVSSAVATLAVQAISVAISSPGSIPVGPGSNLVINASVSGAAPLTLQWYKNGVAVAGATSATFGLGRNGVFDAGQYVLVANNTYGSVMSSVVNVFANLGGLLAYEGFNYGQNSSDIGGATGGLGWAGAWVNVAGGSSQSYSNSLTAGTNAPTGYDSRSVNGYLTIPNSSRKGRFLDCSSTGTFAQHGYLDSNGNIGADGTTIYISFLQQPSALVHFYEFEFKRGDLGDAGRIGGIGNDTGDTHAHLRIEAPAGGTSTMYDLGPGSTGVNFYVLRIDFHNGNDTVTIYRNPASTTEPATPTVTVTTVADMSFNGISFGAYLNTVTVSHDEVRAGMTWADVVGSTISQLKLAQHANNASALLLAASPNYNYQVQGATNVTGPWTNLGNVAASTLGTSQFADTNAAGPQEFYRAMNGTVLLASASTDIVLADFEQPAYGTWVTTGTAFGSGPAQGTLANQGAVSGYQGSGLVNSFNGGDTSTGTLTSPPFVITKPYLDFLIGGGNNPGQTCLNLIVSNVVVMTATGANSETLAAAQWNVSAYLGQTATLQIVDSATGGWGHILIDEITLSDSAFPSLTRTMLLTNNLLNLPVQNSAAMQRVTVTVGGNPVRDFNIKLAVGTPDWWAFVDVSAFTGQTASLTLNGSSTAAGLSSIVQTNGLIGATNLYRESLRPQIHFSSKRGWLNDANGMVYYQGQYHLYYQHDPFNWDGSGQKWWGHAVSPDMVQWTELQEGLYSHTYGDQVYSGSAVVDTNNTGSFKTGTNDVFVAAFYSTARGECIAYSNDGGLTYTDYSNNPVVVHSGQGRDPHMFWYAPSNYWVMAVYDDSGGNGVQFYTTPDFRHWTFRSKIYNGFFECPDMFQLPVDGNATNLLWELNDGSGGYQLGQFNGATFTPSTAELTNNLGSRFYASQTFTSMAPGDNRKVRIGWAIISTPGMPFNELMYFPTVLTLTTQSAGVRLCSEPVTEIANLTATEYAWTNLTLAAGSNPLSGIRGNLFNLQAQFVPGTAELDFTFQGLTVAYNPSTQQITCNGNTKSLPPVNGVVQLQILTDINTIEIFGNHGQLYMPLPATYPTTNRLISVTCQSGSTTFNSLTVDKLKSAWAGLVP